MAVKVVTVSTGDVMEVEELLQEENCRELLLEEEQGFFRGG